MRSKTRFGALLSLVFVLALIAGTALPAYAHHKDDHTQGPSEDDRNSGEQGNKNSESDHDGDADSDPNTAQEDSHEPEPDATPSDNQHPSGKDRSGESGGSGNQGKAESNPDDSKGPQRFEGARGDDKPGGPGGTDLADQDGNNGCGNDDDFDDDNNGHCGRRQDTPPPPPGGQGGNLACPSGFSTFKIDANPSGTYSDGVLTVTIFNNDGDSFSWTANQTVNSVLVKGGPTTKINAGGTSGFAEAAFNPNSGQLYGISHVTFCYTPEDDDVLPKPPITQDVCPAGTDNAGTPYTNIKDCDEDDVDVRIDKVCPAGTDFAGLPMTNRKDCVLGTVIRRGPEPRPAPEAVLPFTGAGSIATFLIAAMGLIVAGLAALKVRSSH